jgi:hypothetical protein
MAMPSRAKVPFEQEERRRRRRRRRGGGGGGGEAAEAEEEAEEEEEEEACAALGMSDGGREGLTTEGPDEGLSMGTGGGHR